MTNCLDVSIVIVSFNTARHLDDCIQSVYDAHPAFSFEIIVVDNASADGSVELVRRQHDRVRIVANSTNELFAKANNQGARIATGRYLLLLNSDTIVAEGGLEKLVEFLDRSPDRIACVGPTVRNADGTLQSAGFALPSISERLTSCFRLDRLLPRWIARLVLPMGTPGLEARDHEVGWVAGCCMLIRRSVYQTVGGLNEALVFYGEEPELGWRLRRAGYETWLVPAAEIVHLGGRSSATPEAAHVHEVEAKLHGYAQLSRFTVGCRRAVLLSEIVLLSARLKRLVAREPHKREFLSNAIRHERRVIAYLRDAARRERSACRGAPS